MDSRSRTSDKTNQENVRLQFASKLIAESSKDNRKRATFGEVGNKLRVSIKKNRQLPYRPTTVNCIAPVAMQPSQPKPINCKDIKPKIDIIASVKRSNMKNQNGAVESYSYSQVVTDDPGEDYKNDPYMVTEYIEDIFKYMRIMEDKYPIRKGFLDGRGITPEMRGILVDWLIEVHLEFEMHLETLHMCVSLIDRYIQDNEQVGRDIYQLVGASALLIAAKYEEYRSPCLSDLKFLCGNVYSERKFLQMERDILNKLDFGLGRPLSIHFLRRYSKIAKVRSIHHILGNYMLELALIEYDMSHVKPSLQAAAACCLSIGILNDVSDLSKLWTPTLVRYTGYEYAEFEEVVVCFAKILIKSSAPRFYTIRRKYAGPNCAKISSSSLLKGSLVRKLSGETTNQ
ncbi:G2/mitotic-specific cyclin-B2-like [Leptinotarsa decemlineata]|uniref:G2/mitotic-specific cyclin-B2-like n=1 Tax=Leptinotarsa decemlineata TaxID=7539 RepID=UPI003D308BCE